MKPILFSTSMVQAILTGRKTMTRRVIKPQPNGDICFGICQCSTDAKNVGKIGFGNENILKSSVSAKHQPGDILWVRETWCKNGTLFMYKANSPHLQSNMWIKWHPSIHMPREAARIFLRVTDVRAERLQDISVEDVMSEGLPAENEIRNPDPATHESIKKWNLEYAHHIFRELWDSINSKRGYGWDKNPWVWVISFERIDSPEAEELIK